MPQARTIIQALRRFRDAEAKRKGVEGYRILQNETIELIGKEKPQTNLELLNIKGIGPAKSKKYGETILRIVEESEEESSQDPEGESKIYSVGEFLDVLNRALEKKTVSIRGEVTECSNKSYASYVTLKDPTQQALLKCYVPKRAIPESIEIEEGMEIVVTGHPHVHKVYNFALQVHEVMLTGEGVLLKALEELKKKLKKEGLFEKERKQAITPFVRTIGLITAPGSDAERDVKTHLGSWGMRIRHFGVRVEGVRAVSEVVAAINWFNEYAPDTDVLVLTRGGGSLESLQAFNSEKVARAIAASKIPVICGVGHERDVSVADLVADVRVSTPTHAGRFISERWQKVEDTLGTYTDRFVRTMNEYVVDTKNTLDRFADRFEHALLYIFEGVRGRLREVYIRMHSQTQRTFEVFRRLETKFNGNVALLKRTLSETKRSLAHLQHQLNGGASGYIQSIASDIDHVEKHLASVNPELKLKQGYSIAFDDAGEVIRSIQNIKKGEEITTRLSDGSVSSVVEDTKEE